ncbi:MAG: hypothetical protein ACR2PR_06620 [Pseudohongiellaceae bacterium]
MSLTFEERIDGHVFDNWDYITPEFDAIDADDDVIEMPYQFDTRPYQDPLYDALLPADGSDPVKRAVEIWHRRAGKDKTVWNITITRSQMDVGYYLYLFPTSAQAKKAIWLGRGGDKIKFMDHIPPELVANTNKTEMYIEMTNGSIIQLGGSDNFDAYMGTNPIWIVFSEWAICNPVAWDYFRPILVENNGTAVFIYTPRGRNHGYTTYKRAVAGMRADSERWHASLLGYKTTGVLTEEQVRREVEEEGMSGPKAEQEFDCSFDAEIEGAIFGTEMRTARSDNRVGFFPVDKALPVITAWDLGRSDFNAIWFAQVVGREIRLVHYYQNRLKGMPHYIQYCKEWARNKEVSLHHTHFAPHDINVTEYAADQKRIDVATQHGWNFTAVGRTSEEDGISAIRKCFPRFFIDEHECEHGISAVEEYQFDVKKEDEALNDEMMKTWSPKPKHNWASHGTKALQYLCQGLDDTFLPGYVDPLLTLSKGDDFDVFD